MDVSVIIPSHNAADTLGAALSSVFSQEIDELEVIVVNDCSTDGTQDLLSVVEDRRLKVVECELGCAAGARNVGLAASRGRYVQFLDADDLLAPNKLVLQLRQLQKSEPDVIASCPWAHFTVSPADAVRRTQAIDRDMMPLEWLIQAWSGGGMAQTACWLTPRKLIEAAGPWNTALRGNPNDDGEFFCRVLLQASAIVFTAGTCVYYRRPRAGSVSQVRSERQAESLLGSYRECAVHLLQREDSSRTRAAAAQGLYRFLYEYDGIYPRLCLEARNALHLLGWPECTAVGPARFQRIVRWLGFAAALKLRRIQKRLRTCS